MDALGQLEVWILVIEGRIVGSRFRALEAEPWRPLMARFAIRGKRMREQCDEHLAVSGRVISEDTGSLEDSGWLVSKELILGSSLVQS